MLFPKLALLISFLILGLGSASYAEASSPDTTFPVYLAKSPNPNSYSLFANGGWDGNWYVGYNTCWIRKLPPIPPGRYARAYIGAKLGRMKLLMNAKNVWDKQPVPGSIYMAIASTTAWSKDQTHLLTATDQIPLEGDYESAVEGTGEAEWFWKEIPLNQITTQGPNFLALGSSSPALINVSSSPVLAAAWGGKEEDTWLLRDVQGAPPATPGPIGTPISYFQPAMALKLIPQGPAHELQVNIVRWENAASDNQKPTIIANVRGDSIERAWLEYSVNDSSWTPLGRPLWKSPYIFSLEQAKLPTGRVHLRIVATNVWEERATSTSFAVEVRHPK